MVPHGRNLMAATNEYFHYWLKCLGFFSIQELLINKILKNIENYHFTDPKVICSNCLFCPTKSLKS